LNDISCNFKWIQIQFNLIDYNSNSIGFRFNWIEFKNIVWNSNLLHLKFKFDLILFYLNLIELNSNSVENKSKLMPKKYYFIHHFHYLCLWHWGKKFPKKKKHMFKKKFLSISFKTYFKPKFVLVRWNNIRPHNHLLNLDIP
jgi:hypothetical protein